ncbi:CHAT domain-containing protein [Streptomyces flaveolus]|uniref:CHAT domain-containing protein n=1 Tax=Streptomyces flaveolus TaxID=67297 RepID=UPI00341BB631
MVGVLLSRDALEDAVHLLLARRPGGTDHAALAAAGTLFLYRSQLIGGSKGTVEFVAAVHLLGPLHAQWPEAVPPQLRHYLELEHALADEVREAFSQETGFTTRAWIWWELCKPFAGRYTESQDLGDLRLAIDLLRLGHTAAADDDPDRPAIVHTLIFLLSDLRGRSYDPGVCREIIGLCSGLLSGTVPIQAPRALMCANLGVAALTLARQEGDPEAAATAVKAFREAVRLTEAAPAQAQDGRSPARAGQPAEDDAASYRHNLAAALAQWGQLTGDDEALLEALAMTRRALDGDARALNNFEVTLRTLLTRPAAAQAALERLCRQWLPEPGRPMAAADVVVLRVLCLLIIVQYRATRTLPLLREAISHGRRLLSVVEGPELLGEAAHNTASLLVDLAQRTHDPQAAREAVTLAEQAAIHARSAPLLEEPVVQGTLAAAHLIVFELTDNPQALRDAVRASRRSVEEPAKPPAPGRGRPGDSPVEDLLTTQFADRLLHHSRILHAHGARTTDRTLLDESLATARRALTLPTLTVEQHVTARMQASKVLTDLFALDKDGPVTGLEEAVRLCEEASRIVAPGGFAEPFLIDALVRAQRLLGKATGDAALLRRAVDTADQVLTRPGPAVRGTLLSLDLERSLAASHLAALENDDMLRGEALAGFDRLTDEAEARPSVRMTAALRAIAAVDPTDPDAMTRLGAAVDLLRLNVAGGPRWSDREHALRNYSLLTERIVMSALAAGDPVGGVRLLELSRGLLSEDAMDLRRDPAWLGPELQEEFRDLSQRMRALDLRDRGASQAPEATGLDREIADERTVLNQRLVKLRETAPPSTPDPRETASQGPVVIVTTLDSGGQALLITSDAEEPVRFLHLPGFDTQTVTDRVLTFLTAREFATNDRYPLRARRLAQGEVRATLEWLWTTAAHPILQALDLDRRLSPTATGPAVDWPRLWWCPTGFLGYLPWHAAGTSATTASGDGVLDRVVSSYTASLRALEYARRPLHVRHRSRTLVVPVPKVSGAEPLRGVDGEVRSVRELIPDALVLTPEESTRERVTTALADHGHVHLACHAMTNIHAPGSSRLLLADHRTAPLTVADIAGLHLPDSELAMLSACSTHEISPDLSEESLHLTGAFQLAGFRHVIGALWPVSDATAGDVSRAVYKELTGNGQHAPRTADSARALHMAVRALRASFPAAPTMWASYIHTGA